ncbi:GntR family transcriptional regulator [Rhizobiaceae bacterium BDR2-2]|uniref:GntR family transcriptional regulator n=1 Tax=Ectorhizobium quercum TaxID=2965071 RepID=A0AAE3MYU4_9HYPH|nr:GntR family transcriptional regulator [Ectorhizobium quercum]MCX8996986.1 GntR family transcriptional regulator [Ectorhizobium quercum]
MDLEHTAEDIAQLLEEDIVLCRILPRERLPEDQLMERFGTKRHVIRKALQLLATTGVLEHIPNKGAQVRAFSPDEVRNLYDLRALLETEAASKIPLPLTPEAEEKLREAQSVHDAAVEADDPARIFRANIAFHRELFSLCPNPFLVEAVEMASRRAHGIRFAALGDPDAVREAREQHYAMIAAAVEGRRDDLIRLCREHLPASGEAYLRLTAPLARRATR